MTKILPSRRAALAGFAAAGLAPAVVRAQQYPNRPVRWIIGYAAGGGTDVLARLVGAAMSQQLGQQVVVENRPGAATNLAAGEAARAAPDGYTLFTAGIETLVYNPALYKKLPFDPDKDLRPVGLTARFHLLLSVRKESPIKSARELVDRAKAAPGKMNYGSPGIGSPHHLAMERFLKSSGTQMQHVPYRGLAPVLTDLMGGVIETGFVDFAAGRSMLLDGALRPLAVASAKRLDALPDVPTVEEAMGSKPFEAYAWQGVVVPAATPDPIVSRLTGVLSSVVAQEAIRKRMLEIGLDPLPGGPGEFNALLKSERDVWWPVIRELGISLE